MDFAYTDEQLEIERAVQTICKHFDADYWRTKDRDGGFPHDFHAAFAQAGWLGIAMPTEVGGSGLGITEAAIMMRTIAASGAGMSGASAIHMNIFGLQPVVVHGTPEQQQRWLPPMIAGREKACFGVTEPNTGLNTLRLKTRAVRQGDRYVVNGQKVWISTAQVADKILLLARTADPDPAAPSRGLSLFYTDLDRSKVEVREIDKHGRKAVDSNQLFIDGLEIPVEDRIGEEGRGFEYILHGLNPERVLIAAEAVGLGRVALQRAALYANERIVFDRPIGKNQGVAFPIAEAYMEVEAANLMRFRACELFDAHQPCGAEANMAKHLAAKASWEAANVCLQTHGGFGFACEYDVERKFRETRLYLVAPISTNLIFSYIAEHVLGMPRSF